MSEDGKLYAVGEAVVKGSESPVELLFGGDAPVVAACIANDGRILAACKDGTLLSLQKGNFSKQSG